MFPLAPVFTQTTCRAAARAALVSLDPGARARPGAGRTYGRRARRDPVPPARSAARGAVAVARTGSTSQSG